MFPSERVEGPPIISSDRDNNVYAPVGITLSNSEDMGNDIESPKIDTLDMIKSDMCESSLIIQSAIEACSNIESIPEQPSIFKEIMAFHVHRCTDVKNVQSNMNNTVETYLNTEKIVKRPAVNDENLKNINSSVEDPINTSLNVEDTLITLPSVIKPASKTNVIKERL